MCGIAGIFGLYDEKLVNNMLLAQAHRGPDGMQVWGDEKEKITLGHVRLSILDVSDKGIQPMAYANGRFQIIFNGEIYNFKDIRQSLIKLGHEFNSHTDTEVILASYLQWGTSCVNKFRGMFAFALFDKTPKANHPRLFLARDRFGIKPLLYFNHNNNFFFASEIRALLSTGHIDKTINKEAIIDYFSHGVVYQPNTIIDGIQSLPSGHYLEIFSDSTKKLSQYWDLHEATTDLRKELKQINKDDAVATLRKLLNDATRYALVSDVEVGAFLSGGIDSTAVVGLMTAVGGKKINSYALGFEDKLGSIDERKYAEIASNHLDSNHIGKTTTIGDAKVIFNSIVNDIDQPSIDGTNTWIVSKVVAGKNKVALSGLGGDEIFAGYPHFYNFAKEKNNLFLKLNFLKKYIRKIHSLRPNFLTLNIISKISSSLEKLSFLRTVFEDFQIKQALLPKWGYKSNVNLIEKNKEYMLKDADSTQQMTYFELNTYLRSTLLRDSDVMSMAHGLEIRPLLLDHVLVEFVYSLPERIKLSQAYPKKVFVDSVSELIPDELKRRKKMGFEMPFVEWMKGPLKNDFIKLLESEYALSCFRKKYIEAMIKRLKNNKPPRNLWAVGVFVAWIKENGIRIN
ncbi:asparagine synthase (glutamine-hydrolyzing) [bacterium]|nr:asparagine synthase (glutamine-hydrolyzing) [bacterium]